MTNLFEKLRYKTAVFMYGRYGNDALTKFLLVLGLILMIISWFPRLGWVYFLAAAVLVWSLVRSFSRKIDRRRRELDCYLRFQKPIVNFFKLSRNKWRDRKTHVYFKCKKCKAVLRVPRGKGSIIVTCPKCGERIEKNT